MVLINMGDENKAIDGYDINKEYGAWTKDEYDIDMGDGTWKIKI
jgi:hypothetical protein